LPGVKENPRTPYPLYRWGDSRSTLPEDSKDDSFLVP